MSHVLIIGGGAVGAALTYRLAAAGAGVTLLDRRDIGSGTTSATFSMTVAARKTPRAHFDLAVAGAAEHRRLVRELAEYGITEDWVHPVSAYEWATTEHDSDVIAARVDRLTRWGYPVQWIERSDLCSAEPHLAVDSTVTRAAAYPHEAWYDAPRMTAALAYAAARAGARLLTHRHVETVTRHASGVDVITAEGERHTADHVVVCAGAQSREVAALAGHHLRVGSVPGLVVTSRPTTAGTLRGIVLRSHVNLRPAPNGALLAHSYTTEADLPDALDNPLRSPWTDQVVAQASTLVPAFGQAGPAEARVGLRPLPADGLPVAGWLDDRVYTLVGHSGINLAPILARLAAPEILDQASSDDLAPFRPSRESLIEPEADSPDESTREMTRIFTAGSDLRQASTR